jgi:hypothetical protein
MQNSSMDELFIKSPAVESMMVTISQEMLKTAPWGLIWRVSLGAALSILDLGTDCGQLHAYFSACCERFSPR